MHTLTQLWLPILLSAVGVFLASSILHMLLKFWHMPDYRGLANEDEVAAALRRGNPKPGMYTMPYCTMENMGTPEMQEKMKQGPVGFMILRAPGLPNMGIFLGMWFVFCLVVSLLAGYIGAATIPAGTGFGRVMCVTGMAAFMTYGLCSIPAGIWWGQPWKTVAKDVIDGVIYALITGALFAWLWPAA